MQNNRVLFLLDFFSSFGGTEFYNFNLIIALHNIGNEINVVIGERPQNIHWINKLTELGIPVYYPEKFHETFQSRDIELDFYLNKAGSIIEQFDPNIIYVHPMGKMLITYLENSSESAIPIIATDYTVAGDNTAHWYNPEIQKYINRISVFISRCLKEENGIRNFHGFKGPIVSIPHLITEDESITWDDGASHSIGCIVRLSPEKGLGFLLGAWKMLLKEYPDLTLHIYGHGIYKDYYEELTRCLGIANSVVFEGTYTPITGINEVASRHRIFIQPSLFESIPNAMLELILRKRVVVATKVGGIPEIISPESGFLVEEGSTDQIYSAIKRILDNEEESLVKAHQVYQKTKEKYNYARNINEICNVFKEYAK